MKIKSMHIQNYKCLRDVSLNDLSNMIALVGPNMSGKSTVFDVLNFLNEAYKKSFKDALLNRKGFKALITSGELAGNLKIKIEITIELDLSTRDILLHEIDVKASDSHKRVYESDFLRYLYYLFEFRMSTDNDYYYESLSTDNVEHNNKVEVIKIFNKFPEYQQTTFFNNLQEQFSNVIRGGVFAVSHATAKPQPWNYDNAHCFFYNKSQRRLQLEYKIIDAVENYMSKWQSLSPYIAIQDNFSSSSTEQLDYEARNISGVIHTLLSSTPSKLTEIQKQLSRIIKTDELFTPISESTVTIAAREAGQRNAFEIRNLSAGFKYLLAVITRLVTAESGSLILLEEPENHLHPEAIRQLIQIISKYSSMHQIFFTTHSPVALMNFSIANIFLTERDEKGNTTIRKTDIDNVDAVIEGLGICPSDFFENELVIFVEGEYDVAIYGELSKKIIKNDADCCFIDTGGWTNMPFFANARILEKLRVPPRVVVIFDGDTSDEKQKHAYGIVKSRMHVSENNIKRLHEKEIECHLLDTASWFKTFPSLDKTIDEQSLKKEFEKIKTDIKPREAMTKLIGELNLGRYTIDVAVAIAHNMNVVPTEISDILEYAYSLLGAAEKEQKDPITKENGIAK